MSAVALPEPDLRCMAAALRAQADQFPSVRKRATRLAELLDRAVHLAARGHALALVVDPSAAGIATEGDLPRWGSVRAAAKTPGAPSERRVRQLAAEGRLGDSYQPEPDGPWRIDLDALRHRIEASRS